MKYTLNQTFSKGQTSSFILYFQPKTSRYVLPLNLLTHWKFTIAIYNIIDEDTYTSLQRHPNGEVYTLDMQAHFHKFIRERSAFYKPFTRLL